MARSERRRVLADTPLRVVFASAAIAILASGCSATTSHTQERDVVSVTVTKTLHGVSLNAPKHVDRVDLKAVTAALDKECAALAEPQTTVEMQEAGGQKKDCLERQKKEALATVTAAMSPADAFIMNTLASDQEAYFDDVCWLSEEAIWIDWNAGVRSDGSYRYFRWLECEQNVRLEQTLLIRAIEGQDAKEFASRVESLQEAGKHQSALRTRHEAGARSLQVTPLPAAPMSMYEPQPLNREERAKALARVQQIGDDTPTLAKSTCTAFPDLERRLGGQAACINQVANYYFALGNYSPSMSADDDS